MCCMFISMSMSMSISPVLGACLLGGGEVNFKNLNSSPLQFVDLGFTIIFGTSEVLLKIAKILRKLRGNSF
jgi:hypothetical protein